MALDWGALFSSAGQGIRDYAFWKDNERERRRQLRLQGIFPEDEVATEVPETRTFQIPTSGADLARTVAIPEDPELPGSAATLQMQRSTPATLTAVTGRTRKELPQGAVSIGDGEVYIPSRSLAGIAAEQQFGRQRELAEMQARDALNRERASFGWRRGAEREDAERSNRGNYELGRTAGLGGLWSQPYDPNIDYSGASTLINARTQERVAGMYSSREREPKVPQTFQDYFLMRAREMAEPTKAIDGSVIWDPEVVNKVKLQAAQEWLVSHPDDPYARAVLEEARQPTVEPTSAPSKTLGDRLSEIAGFFGLGGGRSGPSAPPTPSDTFTSTIGRPMAADTFYAPGSPTTTLGAPKPMTAEEWAQEAARLRASGVRSAEILERLGPPPAR